MLDNKSNKFDLSVRGFNIFWFNVILIYLAIQKGVSEFSEGSGLCATDGGKHKHYLSINPMPRSRYKIHDLSGGRGPPSPLQSLLAYEQLDPPFYAKYLFSSVTGFSYHNGFKLNVLLIPTRSLPNIFTNASTSAFCKNISHYIKFISTIFHIAKMGIQ